MINIELLREYVEAGDRIGYWTALDQMGDPYGALALGVALNDSIAGATANGFFLRGALDERDGDGITPEELADVSHKLMVEDFELRRDEADGILDSRQIERYHEVVFAEKGVSIEAWTAHAPLDILDDKFDYDGREDVWASMLTDSLFWNGKIAAEMAVIANEVTGDFFELDEQYSAIEWFSTVFDLTLAFDIPVFGLGSQSGDYGSYTYGYENPFDPSQTTIVIGGSENGDVIEGYDAPDPDGPFDPFATDAPSGNDILIGFAGDDTLTATSGTDRLYGGSGADDFVLTNGRGTTLILDADQDDRLLLRFDETDMEAFLSGDMGSGPITFVDVDASSSVEGGGGISDDQAIVIGGGFGDEIGGRYTIYMNTYDGTEINERLSDDDIEFIQGEGSDVTTRTIFETEYFVVNDKLVETYGYEQGTVPPANPYFEVDFLLLEDVDEMFWPELDGFTLDGDELIVRTRYNYIPEINSPSLFGRFDPDNGIGERNPYAEGELFGLVVIDDWQEGDAGIYFYDYFPFGDWSSGRYQDPPSEAEITRAMTALNLMTDFGAVVELENAGSFSDDGEPINVALSNVITGTEGSDTLAGTAGDEVFVGRGGADRYAWGLGDGTDVIVDDTEAGEATEVVLAGLTLADVRVERVGGDNNALVVASAAPDPEGAADQLAVVAAAAPELSSKAPLSSLGGQVVTLRLEGATYHAVMDRGGSYVLTAPGEQNVDVLYPDPSLPAVVTIDGRTNDNSVGSGGIRWASDGESLIVGQGDARAIVGSLATRGTDGEAAALTGDAFLLIAYAGGERVLLAHDGRRAVVVDASGPTTLVEADGMEDAPSSAGIDWALHLDEDTVVTDLSIDALPFDTGADEATIAVRHPDGSVLALISEPIGASEGIGNTAPMVRIEDDTDGSRVLTDLGGSYLWADPAVAASISGLEKSNGSSGSYNGPDRIPALELTGIAIDQVSLDIADDGGSATLLVDGEMVGTLLNVTTRNDELLTIRADGGDPITVAADGFDMKVAYPGNNGTTGDDGDEGTTSTRTDVDGSVPWDTKTTIRGDQGGRIEERTLFDNGDERVDLFSGDVRRSSVFEDMSGTRAWLTRSTAFDESGERTSTTFVYDDGRQRVTEFKDGVRTVSTLIDATGDQLWATRRTEFDADGARSVQTIVFDDGDVRTNAFEGDVLATSVFEDVSDERAWTTRTRTFDADSNVTDTAYTWDDPLIG